MLCCIHMNQHGQHGYLVILWQVHFTFLTRNTPCGLKKPIKYNIYNFLYYLYTFHLYNIQFGLTWQSKLGCVKEVREQNPIFSIYLAFVICLIMCVFLFWLARLGRAIGSIYLLESIQLVSIYFLQLISLFVWKVRNKRFLHGLVPNGNINKIYLDSSAPTRCRVVISKIIHT